MRFVLAVALFVGLVTLCVILGNSVGADGAAVIVGVIFGVAAAIPTALIVALLGSPRGGRGGQREYHEHHQHFHDNRKALIYLRRDDGSLELLQEIDARQIEAPVNGTKVTVNR